MQAAGRSGDDSWLLAKVNLNQQPVTYPKEAKKEPVGIVRTNASDWHSMLNRREDWSNKERKTKQRTGGPALPYGLESRKGG